MKRTQKREVTTSEVIRSTVDSLFDVALYKQAEVTKPDLDTVVLSRVNGTNLTVNYRRRLRDWDPYMIVTASLDGQDSVVFTGRVEAKMQHFWQTGVEVAFNQSEERKSAMIKEAFAILEQK